jgi:WD40 repeat protein
MNQDIICFVKISDIPHLSKIVTSVNKKYFSAYYNKRVYVWGANGALLKEFDNEQHIRNLFFSSHKETLLFFIDYDDYLFAWDLCEDRIVYYLHFPHTIPSLFFLIYHGQPCFACIVDGVIIQIYQSDIGTLIDTISVPKIKLHKEIPINFFGSHEALCISPDNTYLIGGVTIIKNLHREGNVKIDDLSTHLFCLIVWDLKTKNIFKYLSCHNERPLKMKFINNELFYMLSKFSLRIYDMKNWTEKYAVLNDNPPITNFENCCFIDKTFIVCIHSNNVVVKTVNTSINKYVIPYDSTNSSRKQTENSNSQDFTIDASFSDDSRYVAFIYQGNLYIIDTNKDKKIMVNHYCHYNYCTFLTNHQLLACKDDGVEIFYSNCS